MFARISSSIAVVVVVLLFASSARADDARDIVGVWVPTALESDGTVLTAEQVKSLASQLTFTITSEKITAPLHGANEIGYELGMEAVPKTIDTTDLNGPRKGEVRKGIYELRGDTFRLCMAAKDAPRPQNFSTKPGEAGNGEMLITFLRKKP
jgi:uncharacterized protein (TIGR03067 family)